MSTIFFRGLNIQFDINPIAFQFYNIKIYWYGIIIAAAFLIGFLVLMRIAKTEKYDQDLLTDIILITTPIAIIGARLYYVTFRLDEYRNNLGEVYKVWHGGLAIYGAIIFSIISVIAICKVKKIEIWPILDMAAPGLVIAQAIGRWGNFVNQEAYGGVTNLPWAMTILENGIYKSVHPTFLYESLWNLCVFLFLIWFFKRRKNAGEVFLAYIGLYSFGRFWIETLRADSLYFAGLKISQLVAVFFIIFALVLFIKRRKKNVCNL